jgi:hypothetical protein
VRNAARPVGLTTTLDWFVEQWQREETQVQAAETRARRSARVARVRRRAPIAVSIVAAAAIVTFAGVAAARLLGQRGTTWNTSAGAVGVQADTAAARSPAPSLSGPPSPRSPSLADAAALLDRGDAIAALRAVDQLRLADSSAERYAADSLLAAAAIRGAGDVLASKFPPLEPLQLIVRMTTDAIARANPGTAVVAPLSLARAGACIGGNLGCPADQVREDLAWAVLLGTPSEQDDARRLRATLVGDTLRVVP